jgi:hypothetical protein
LKPPAEGTRDGGNDSRAGLRKFILKAGLFLSVWGVVLLHDDWGSYGRWVASWTAILGIALVFPRPVIPIRAAIRRLGRLLGAAITFIALAAIYFLVVTPLGLVARLFRKEFLELRWDRRAAASYWRLRDPSPVDKAAMERQY